MFFNRTSIAFVMALLLLSGPTDSAAFTITKAQIRDRHEPLRSNKILHSALSGTSNRQGKVHMDDPVGFENEFVYNKELYRNKYYHRTPKDSSRSEL